MNSGAFPEGGELYAAFAGDIGPASVQRIIAGAATAMAHSTQRLHLAFQSTGGYIGDGVCIYNYFKALPLPLTLYNIGTVSSIATVAYLGAKERKASAHATFMMHRTHSQEPTTAGRLKSLAQTFRLDNQRTDAILREHLHLSRSQWRELDRHELTLSAREALDVGLATEVGEFAPPPGTRIYNV